MDTASWALAAIGAIAAFFAIIRFALDQIPGMADSFARAVAALRDASEAARGRAASENPVMPVRSEADGVTSVADARRQDLEGSK